MGQIQDLQRKISSLNRAVAARDKTIATLRKDLQGANARAGKLESALSDVADGLKPLVTATGKASRVAKAVSALPEGGLRDFESCAELLPILTDGGLLEQLRGLAPLAGHKLPGGGSHEEFAPKLLHSLGQVIDEIEELADRMPEPADLPLRPLLQLMSRLIEEAPEAARSRLRAFWEAGRIFAWIEAVRATKGEPAVQIALIEYIISVLETASEIWSLDIEVGGEAAAAYLAGVGAGGSITLVSVGSTLFGFVNLALEAWIILIDEGMEPKRLAAIGA